MVETVVVTCASGSIGENVVPLLSKEPQYKLRLIVNSEKSHPRLQQQWPRAEVMRADLADAVAANKFVAGATIVFYISPPFHAHETSIGYSVIDAAVKAGRHVEEYLIESGLDYTILQPTHFMDIFPTATLMKQEQPVWPALFDPNTAFSFIALRDYAEVAPKVVKEREAHFFATYFLTSTLPISYAEVAKSVGRQIGKDIRIERKNFEEAVGMFPTMVFRTKDLDSRVRDLVERILLYYNTRGISGNPGVLEWLLGRKATNWDELTKIQIETAT